MITAVFRADGDTLLGFRISGHSGYSEQGSDIVCAAVSAMVMLTVNTACDIFGAEASTETDESDASVDFSLLSESEIASSLLRGFRQELLALERDFPDHIRVITEH